MSNKERYSLWRSRSADVRAKYQLSSSFAGWTNDPGGRSICGAPAVHRLQDLVNVAWGVRVKTAGNSNKGRDALAHNYFVDLSQSVKREPWSEGMDVLTTSSIIYAFSEDRVLEGSEHVRLQGHPAGQSPETQFSDYECRSLAGEAFAAPCIAVASAAFMLNPWAAWRRPAPISAMSQSPSSA